MILNSLFPLALALGSPPDVACTGPLTRDAVAACAAAVSPELVADQERIAAARGEAESARVALPDNPTLAVTVGQRWNTVGDQSLNVAGTVSQRLEIGGQRRFRRAEAAAVLSTRKHEAATTRRHVIARALRAYYDLSAARDELAVIERGRATALQLRDLARARAETGVGNPMDGEVAAAEATALDERVALAKGRIATAEALLSSALGLDPNAELPDVRTSLDPLPVPAAADQATRLATQRPEMAERESEQRARQAQLRLLKRERVPNPSLSVFAQTDGFNERVIGGGISIPLPLPYPVGRTNRGAIDAVRAEIRAGEAGIDAQRRALTLEAAVAYREYQARTNAADVYTDAALASAEASLSDLAAEIERGTLPVQDALRAQQSFVAVLLRAIESKHAACRASVTLALMAGSPLEGGAR